MWFEGKRVIFPLITLFMSINCGVIVPKLSATKKDLAVGKILQEIETPEFDALSELSVPLSERKMKKLNSQIDTCIKNHETFTGQVRCVSTGLMITQDPQKRDAILEDTRDLLFNSVVEDEHRKFAEEVLD